MSAGSSTSCSNPDCPKPSTDIATKRCSACHKTRYCSTHCSKADWPQHKSKCMSEKNINAILDRINAEHAAKPVPRPSATKCTGCGIKFAKDDYDEDEDEKLYAEEACDDCGYMACESCACSHSRGSCYCQNSNFGTPYCTRVPAYYHGGRAGSYDGDRHPEEYVYEHPEAFEATPRACDNCGEVTLCLKKEWLRG